MTFNFPPNAMNPIFSPWEVHLLSFIGNPRVVKLSKEAIFMEFNSLQKNTYLKIIIRFLLNINLFWQQDVGSFDLQK